MHTLSGRSIAFLFVSTLVASAPAQQEVAPQRVGEALVAPDLDAWREYVRPDAGELAAEALPWLPDFPSGLTAAAEQRRPLLLWTMNGHPLGCT